MGQNSKIEWTDHTFNPWRGCEHAELADGTSHPGCEHCYAETMSGRNPTALGQWGSIDEGGRRVRASADMWRQPLKWNAAAQAAGVRARVFCASLADVFEDWRGVIMASGKQPVILSKTGRASNGKDRMTMDDCRRDLFELIDATPWLDWLLLTKRPGNIRRMWLPIAGGCDGECCEYRGNVSLITSVSNQATADELIPELLRCRDLVPVLGLSAEPLLGPINLRGRPPELRGTCLVDHRHDGSQGPCQTRGLDWVIVGGESGHHARPMHPDWARSIRDQCQAAGVAFFFKQWGEWGVGKTTIVKATAGDAGYFCADGKWITRSKCCDTAVLMGRMGKHTAGRLLDGREWGEFPQFQHQGAV